MVARTRIGTAYVDFRARNTQFQTTARENVEAMRRQQMSMRRMRREMRQVRRSAATLTRAFVGYQGGLLLVTGVLQGLTREQAKFGATLVETSTRAGIGVREIQLLERALRGEGVQTERTLMALTRFNVALVQASMGVTTYRRALDAVGIDAEQFLASGEGLTEFLLQFADGLAAIPTEAERLSVAYDLLGQRSTAVVNVFAQGREALEAIFDPAGPVAAIGTISARQAVLLKALDQAYEDLTDRIQTARRVATAALAEDLIGTLRSLGPTLAGVFTSLTQVFVLVARNLDRLINLFQVLAVVWVGRRIINPAVSAVREYIGALIRTRQVSEAAAIRLRQLGRAFRSILIAEAIILTIRSVVLLERQMEQFGVTTRAVFAAAAVDVLNFAARIRRALPGRAGRQIPILRLTDIIDISEAEVARTRAALAESVGRVVADFRRLFQRDEEEPIELPPLPPIGAGAGAGEGLTDVVETAAAQNSALRGVLDLENQIRDSAADRLRVSIQQQGLIGLEGESRTRALAEIDVGNRLREQELTINRELAEARMADDEERIAAAEEAREAFQELVANREELIARTAIAIRAENDLAAARRAADDPMRNEVLEATRRNLAGIAEAAEQQRRTAEQQLELVGLDEGARRRVLAQQTVYNAFLAEATRLETQLAEARRTGNMQAVTDIMEARQALAEQVLETDDLVQTQEDALEAQQKLADAQRDTQEAQNRVTEGQRAYEQIVQRTRGAIGDFAVDSIRGFRSIGDAAQNLGRSIVDNILNTLIRLSANQLFTAFLSATGLGGLGSAFGGALSSAFGGSLQEGGALRPGRVHLVGERGPELLVSGAPGRVYSTAALAGALSTGSGVNLTFSPTIQSTDGPGVREALRRYHPILVRDTENAVGNNLGRPSALRDQARRRGR